MKKAVIAVVAFLFVFLTGTSYATDSFNIETGGTISKGTVQDLFGWNNAHFQDNAELLVFEYVEFVAYNVTCTWTTGPEGKEKEHTTVSPKTIDIRQELEADYIKNKKGQIVRIDFAQGVTQADYDFIQNDPCKGSKKSGEWEIDEDVEPIKALYVTFNGVTHLLFSY
jgi:hypothetical protein